MRDSKERFSSRVENYVKFRPGYPPEVVDVVAREAGLAPGAAIADVGSGTGLLAKLFLDDGYRVTGVEPNREMREAGERLLASFEGYSSVDGSAEATTLADASVAAVVAGQAFHWFDPDASRAEFARILAPGGSVALVWNIRRVQATRFMTEYEELVRAFGTDYEQVSHHGVDEGGLESFFGADAYTTSSLANEQTFDYEGLEGRLRSSSYAPEAGDPRFEPMLEALRALFGRHERDGRVAFLYDTKVYVGRPRR